ncbi:putative DNA-binding transcriptional regulator YafY [Alkalihalobacillus xiaoxiensis]|uniref:DNA-binding transcriptional regulator YafY n=1 Tax=Shouchella xiaoxiensis TaxID=766895 RepID=A0ABS2SY25_9BACI|nr:YafY family protein [Shouchella xiaoxiensis]MBM7839334.1 putative DNA-binding transcriptional regulator YafY [Shouchella xiaoxiensis]
MKIHRLISILLIIETKGPVKAKELAEKLEVSTRTIYRDVDTLCEAGIPLIASTGPTGGIQMVDTYSLGMKQLHEEDLLHLYLSSAGIKPTKGELALKINNALLKLQKHIPEKQKKLMDSAQTMFFIDENPWWGKTTTASCLDTLIQAIFTKTTLAMIYSSHSQSIRRVHPYGIVIKRLDWYLVAYCETRKAIRTFKCNRIEQATVLNEHYTVPASFNLESFWTVNQQQFKLNCAQNEYYPVSFQLHKQDTDLLPELEWLRSEEQDNNLTISANLFDETYAKRAILPLLGFAEIIAPEPIRNHAIALSQQLSARYIHLKLHER